jgi:hypothetical protein
LPGTWEDGPGAVPTIPRHDEIALENRRTVDRVRNLVVSPAYRQAYPGPTRAAIQAFEWGRPRSLQIDTPNGPLIFADRASGSLIERLTPDAGLVAFAHDTERELAILRQIASRPESDLTIAYTPEGTIAGQVSLAPPEGRWAEMPGVVEIGIEIAARWRRSGTAQRLLQFALDRDEIEGLIIIAMGLRWHWDVEDMGLSAGAYRSLVVRLFATAGFADFETDDEEIRSMPENVFLARIGSRVSPERVAEFERRLVADRGDWWGF